jgi:hypothetical protein
VTAPVQLLVIGLHEPTFSGDVRRELERLQEAGIVRVLDILVVTRDADGDFSTVDLPQDAPDGLGRLATAFLTRSSSTSTDDTEQADAMWSLADAVPPGTTAAIAFVEHLWAAPLRAALERGGGVPLEEAWLSTSDLAVLEQLRAAQRV